MGAATCALLSGLGAEVYALDIQEVTFPCSAAIRADLRVPSQIETALDQVGAPIHAIFSCAGVSGPPFSPLEVAQINFIGARHLVELAVDSFLPSGSAVAFISSIGGMGWEQHLGQIKEFLNTPDFESASDWVVQNIAGEPDQAEVMAMIMYAFSKQAIDVYVQLRAVPFIRKGVRINATAPGPTATPLYRATPIWDEFGGTEFRKAIGREPSDAEDQAHALVFLNSDAAGYISGTILNVDSGLVAGALMGCCESILIRALPDDPAGSL
jgi:NAD(P)-dependent dehydrogenase (short-subunit alcohol dehydrogenase family)